MKRTFTPLLLCACTGLIAQPNFPSSYFNSTIGSITTIRMADYLEPGPATNGFVYDASDATLGAATTSQYVDPATTPYASDFPYANLATLTLSQTGYGYAQVTANSMLSWGLESTSQSVIYSNAEKVYPIPLDFGATWSDAWAASIEGGGFSISRTGQTTGAYASYGTVVLPFGTFSNVARVELDQTYSDT